MGPAPLTFDVWSDGGRPPTATEVHDGADSAVVDDGPVRRPTAVPTERGRSLALVVAVLAATVLGASAAFTAFLLAPGLHPAVAPEVAPTDGAVATLSPEQLERLTVRVGDEEWVIVRRPHQGPR